ncbi:hypothetical protein PHYPSEUDO_001493 [Phytophthora pseudosyringae]|uniref:Uncharacterized protein n=1 Tax=Phytophthora pseudosyringae TaxID=221518 RepID=A0A8T1VVY3_9STRA|nr:hypothetical protein PHYPSEUDO_001493 [Phytophthora pseudosyringae]
MLFSEPASGQRLLSSMRCPPPATTHRSRHHLPPQSAKKATVQQSRRGVPTSPGVEGPAVEDPVGAEVELSAEALAEGIVGAAVERSVAEGMAGALLEQSVDATALRQIAGR